MWVSAAAAAKSLQSCLTLCDAIDGSPPGFPHPWESPGKNTGVGCHFLLQCMKVKSESEVASVVSNSAWPHRRQPIRLPPSLGFSRQEYWSGLPFPSPMHKSESEVAQSCPTLSNPMDFSLPGSVHGIFQARVLEWGAIAVSDWAAKYLLNARQYKGTRHGN